MSSRTNIIPGVVKEGVVVPVGDARLPEGALVDIVFLTQEESLPSPAGQPGGPEDGSPVDQWEKEE